jgi:hypothetical protein
MTLLEAHQWWAWPVVLGNAVVGVWALAAHRWPVARHRALWWCTAAAEVAIALQVALGVAVQSRTGIEAPEFHTFYGFVALISVGLIYSYRQQMKDHRYLLYGFGGLFLMGLAIRAMVLTG